MWAHELVCLDMGLALQTSTRRGGVEAASQTVFTSGLVASIGFECAVREVGAEGAAQLARFELGGEPDLAAGVKDLEGAGPFARLEKTTQEKTAVFVSDRDRALESRVDVIGLRPRATAGVGLPIGPRSRRTSIGVVSLAPEGTYPFRSFAREEIRIGTTGREGSSGVAGEVGRPRVTAMRRDGSTASRSFVPCTLYSQIASQLPWDHARAPARTRVVRRVSFEPQSAPSTLRHRKG